jgi:hypothetical protein
MDTNKILKGGIAGAVVYFFLGWLIYGMLLTDYMQANTNQCLMKPMEQMTWWAIILSNVVMGIFLATVFSWSNISSAASGAKSAAFIGLMIALSYDLSFYSMSTMYPSLSPLFVDVLVCTVMNAITGAVVGSVMGMGSKQAA